MAYTPSQEYMKFQKKKCLEESGNSPCGDCGDCNGNCNGCDEECSCCPPGLVAIYDANGVHAGCLTPNDAEEYSKNTFTCKEGYIKLYRNSDGAFLGCVSETEFAAIYSQVNPIVV